MRRLTLSLLISFAIHFILLIILFRINKGQLPVHNQLQIDILSPASIHLPEIRAPVHILTDDLTENLSDPESHSKINLITFDYHFLLDSLYGLISPLSDTSVILNQRDWEQFLSTELKKEYFLSGIRLPSRIDSQLTAFSIQNPDLFQYEHDGINGTTEKTIDDVQPIFSIEKIVAFIRQQLNKKNPPQFNFTPSETQLDIISILSHKNNATQLEIYSFLPSRLSITAEGLDQELDLLTDKGFLVRKKVSPEQIFNFFGILIEMSRKNRLNPVYPYELNINKQELLSYLQSTLSLLKDKLQTHPSDSTAMASEKNSLQQKILMLLQE